MLSAKLFQRIFLHIITLVFITINSYSQENELQKLLSLDLEDLTKIKVISATKTFIKINEVPATVRVITAESIKENGFLTLEDALSNLPGFQFRNILGFNSYVFQRGIPSQNNLILLLVDGIQINELNSGGFYGGGQFNLDNVQQIEVLYGPASALYGTNAISGIINIITKDPEKNKGLSISGLYGSFNTYNGNISYGYYDEENEFGLRLAGMVKSSEKANLAGAEGDFNWSENMENFEDDFTFEMKTEYKNLKFGLIFQNKQSSRTTNFKSVGTKFLDKNTLWNISFFNSYLKHYLSFTETLDLLSTIYFRNATILDNTISQINDTSQVGYYRPNSLGGIESMLSYSPFQDLKLVGGILFEYESLADDFSITYSNSPNEKPPTPPAPIMDNNTLLSVYLQTQYTLNDFFNFFAGARWDHSSIYNNIVTPQFGLVYNENKLTVKFLYSEAFRAPKPWDYTFGSGNSNLKPEEMRSFEISGIYSINESITCDLSFYKNKLYDIIILETNDIASRSTNSGDIETLGLEFNLNYSNKNISSFLNYTYNASVDNEERVVPEIAKNVVNAGFIYHPIKEIGLSMRCSYVGERKNPKLISNIGNDFIDDAFVVNASINYIGFENLRLNLTINNLLDQVYYHPSNRPPDRYRQPQRTFLVKAEYNI